MKLKSILNKRKKTLRAANATLRAIRFISCCFGKNALRVALGGDTVNIYSI